MLFGDLWRRPALAPRDRSLVTVAALIANGQAEQMPFHVNRAMDAGLTEAQLSEVVTHLAFYAGWPRAMSAVPVVQKILADRAQPGAAAQASGPAAARSASSATASGRPPRDRRATSPGPCASTPASRPRAPARVGGGVVTFEPGARTAWHAHPLGQTLIVTSGCGWVQQEGGPVQEIRPGDVVWLPPGAKHWHGATPTSEMSHVAIAEAQDGTSTTWMEHVTDEQYAQGSRVQGGCKT